MRVYAIIKVWVNDSCHDGEVIAIHLQRDDAKRNMRSIIEDAINEDGEDMRYDTSEWAHNGLCYQAWNNNDDDFMEYRIVEKELQ